MSVQDGMPGEGLEAALRASGDVAYVWDIPSDRIAWVGVAGLVLGLPDFSAVATGKQFLTRINPEDLSIRQRAFTGHIARGETFECEYRVRSASGGFAWVQDRGEVAFDDSGVPIRLSGIMRSVTRRKAHEARLEQLAHYDELTQVFNKTRLRNELERALDEALQRKLPGVYLAIGIDKLTLINDAFGWEAADAVIVETGRRLERCIRRGDTIGRVGGDRFGLILGNCSAEDAAAAADKIRATMSETPVQSAAGPIYFTVSVGSVHFPAQAESAAEAMIRAEAALGEAKRAGRDCLVPYALSDDQRHRHRAGMALGERVQRALKQQRVLFMYQPVIGSENGEVAYYECLLRMIGEDGRIISAGEFVPIIEQLGFVRLVDRHVLEMVVEELAQHPTVTLGFNISGLTATDRAWLAALSALLRQRPELAARLIVEITETAAVYDLAEFAHVVKGLRDLGCRIALDDFGVGYTSLRHLRTLPVNMVKIDGSFISNLAASYENQVFIRHLLGLAKGFGFETVAECIETAQEAAILRREGVGYMQGYYFGRPAIERPWLAAAANRPARRLSYLTGTGA